jgi:hypothetical protein
MKFPFSYFNFHRPRTAPEAGSATADEAGSSGAMPCSAARQALPSRSAPPSSEDPAMPPAKRRARLGNAAGQSRLETLPPEVVHHIARAGRLTAPDLVSMSAASQAMKAASEPALSDLYRRSAPGLAQGFLAVRSLAEFKESLSLLKNSGLDRRRHEQLLTSLDTVMQRLPESQRPAAIEAFLNSTDEFAGPGPGPGHHPADEGTPLMKLRRAAQHGLPGLESFVTERHGRPAIHAGENAQDVAGRLGVDSLRLEQMSAWRGSRSTPAGPAYRAATESREGFDRILQRFGIVQPEVIAELDAVHRSPEAAVMRGDNVQDVIARFRIRDSNEALRLAQASVRGPAGRAVREGMSPQEAERHYGLERSPFMLLWLKRIAEARDARAAEGQSLAGRVLRGAGRLLLGAAKQVLERTLEDAPQLASRAAARSFAGRSGPAPAGVRATTAMAAHGRIGHDRGGRRPGATGDGPLDRIMDAAGREVASLPMRPGWQRPA